MWYLLALLGPAVVLCLARALPDSKPRDVTTGLVTAYYSVLVLPLAPLVALAKGPTIRSDRVAVNGVWYFVDRYPLPSWLSWFATPDEPMPGGLYEGAVAAAYAAKGRWWCATTWLWRNSLYGLAWKFGKPATGYLDPAEGQITTRDDIWRWQKTIGFLKFGAGWKVHRADFAATADGGPFLAIPFCTVRFSSQD